MSIQTSSFSPKAYKLFEELRKDWDPKPISEADAEWKDAPWSVSIFALDFAIIHRIQHVIDPILTTIYRNHPELNRRTTGKQLAPLHFAAIAWNCKAAEQLLEAGAQVDIRDRGNWSPLHHAALAGNEEMIRVLVRNGANEDLQTTNGATYRDLFHLTQSASSRENPSAPIRLFYRDETGSLEGLTQQKFKQFTAASFAEENDLTREHLLDHWKTPKLKKDEFSFTPAIKEAYSRFLKAPPTHILSKVTHDANGKELVFSPGLGLFAHKSMPARQIIGEYKGIIRKQRGGPSNPYLLAGCDSEKFRNEIPQVNDGFPNLVLVPIHHFSGLPTRHILVAAEPIGEGSQFLWNYGFTNLKIEPYVELNPKESREFIRSHKIDELIRLKSIADTTGNLTFEEFVLTEKFRYIIQTPASLFLMILDGTIDLSQSLPLQEEANAYMGRVPPPQRALLQSLPLMAAECCRVSKQLSVRFPKTATAYLEYALSLPAKTNILNALKVVQTMNRLLSSEKSSMQDDDVFLGFLKGYIVKINAR